MRIAQVAPLYESIPPKLYGGTERVVSYLTEELVRHGHKVTLFASGDSLTEARLVPMCKQSLRLAPDCVDPLAHHVLMIERVLDDVEDFDLIHFHIDYLHYPRTRNANVAALTTLHGRLDIADLAPLYQTFRDVPVVSISDAQREPLPWLNFQRTVYHGLPVDGLTFQPVPGKYLAFLGRICPEKGLDQAIAIARQTGVELKIAAKIDRVDQAYFDEIIKPLLSGPGVDFVGEIGQSEKSEFLGGALALLLSGSMAGTLWSGDDRSHVLWYSCDCLSSGLRSGTCGRRSQRLHRTQYSPCSKCCRGGCWSEPTTMPRIL
jgi:glycosyltransferase involved in cell wall biosynthesis